MLKNNLQFHFPLLPLWGKIKKRNWITVYFDIDSPYAYALGMQLKFPALRQSGELINALSPYNFYYITLTRLLIREINVH